MGFFDFIKDMFFPFGGNYYEREFGLEADETVLLGGIGYFDPDVSSAMEIFSAAATLVSGSIVRTVGEQFSYIITDKDRLIIGMIGGRSGGNIINYGPENPVKVIDTEKYGDRKMMGASGCTEKTKVVAMKPLNDDPFQVILAESGAKQFLEWADKLS